MVVQITQEYVWNIVISPTTLLLWVSRPCEQWYTIVNQTILNAILSTCMVFEQDNQLS